MNQGTPPTQKAAIDALSVLNSPRNNGLRQRIKRAGKGK
jgi:hypothetical protein